jgi:methylmalonyl-CoA/ethylmalonyl-CoA epimerase
VLYGQLDDCPGGKRHVGLQKGVRMLKKINHIGIAVNSLEEAIPFYRDILCMTFKGVEEVVEYKVKVAFFQIGESKIELLEPTSEESFLVEFLDKNGQGIHHIAYEVEDIEAVISRLEEDGTRMIDKTPRQGAHGAKVAFVHPESSQGVLTELCQMGYML